MCILFRYSFTESLTFPQLLTKRIHDYEPRFTEATDTAYRLSKDPYFSNEQSKALRQDAEDCEKQWDDVLEKATDRMDR